MPLVMADSVTRTFNYENPSNFPNTVYIGDSVLVTYTRSPSGSNYWAVDEYMPNNWNTSEQNPVSNRLRFYIGNDYKDYNFIAPPIAGNYNFNDGKYWTYGDDDWYQFPTETVTVVECSITEETCDNQDNDCDYSIDEDLSRACSENYLGKCAIGTETCSAGVYSGCPTPLGEETIGQCDGLDNNCDGQVDETQNTAADANCNACVENDEFTAYANKWINVEISNQDFVIAANKWITVDGCLT